MSGLSFLAGGCLGLVEAPLRWGEVRLRGLIMDPLLELRLRGEVEPEADLSVLEDACLSCVALVARGSWHGEDDVRGLAEGLGASWGGTVALFIGGE